MVNYSSEPGGLRGAGTRAAAAGARGESEKAKMLQERLYYSFGEELHGERKAARQLMREYTLAGEDDAKRLAVLQRVLGGLCTEDPPYIEAPFTFDYGYNIHLGRQVYINFGCTMLDSARITVGDRVLMGPNVQFYTPQHPLDPDLRNGLEGPEYAREIRVGSDVWIGGCVIILGGVTIGDGCTIGAGAVVTRDIPPRSLAVGNPCRVIRAIPPGYRGPHEKE